MNIESILRMLPKNIINEIQTDKLEKLQEIRIRVNRPLILKYDDDEIVTKYIINQKEILGILQMLCDNSIYSYQTQICNGFITIYGGHRVGITGNIAMKDGKISNINYISSLNFRIAKEVIGISDSIINHVISDNETNNVHNLEDSNNLNNLNTINKINDSNYLGNINTINKIDDSNYLGNINTINKIDNLNKICKINNTLIISPPGCGKTTILRDLTRNISNRGYTVSLIDERGEIAAMYKGVPQNDVGIRCDVMDNVTKSLGMRIAVRSMSPQVIIADEIGTKDDIEAINYGICSGVKGIFSAHASNINELRLNENLNKLYEEKVFKKLIFLEKMGKIKNIYTLNNNMYKSVDEMLE